MSEPTRLDRLVELLKAAPDEIFIQPHNVPDPDAIASCAGLQHLLALRGLKSAIVYDRDIEKVDSVKMLELFGIEMTKARDASTLGAEDWSVLVDGQKGAGNLTDLATDAVGLLDALGIDRAHVLGSSLGGMIAQTIAIEHPSRVQSLTSLMSTTGERDLLLPEADVLALLLEPVIRR